jgi:hypothetical protein
MRKTLKRALDRLRTAAGAKFGKSTSARDGLQEPQQMTRLRS